MSDNQNAELKGPVYPDVRPLTYQQDFWLRCCQPDDLSTRSEQVFALRLSGDLNVEMLSYGIKEVIRRHQALRTRIVLNEGPPCQHIDVYDGHHVEIVPIQGDPLCEPDAARRFVEAFARQSWDLARGPLFEVKLLRWSQREHLLLWAISHFVEDGWSINLIFRELWLLYGELLQGRRSPLQNLPAQYSEYQVWQSHAYDVWRKEHQSYWTHRLSGASGIRWPVNPRTFATRADKIEVVEVSFSAELSDELRCVAKRARAVIAIPLLTAYAAAVSRWCKQEDFVVATTVHGRDRLEHHAIVGLLSHLIYLRVHVKRGETLMGLIAQLTSEFRQSVIRKDFGGLVADNLQLMSDSVFQWLPWGPDEMNGAPLQSESIKIGVEGHAFRFKNGNDSFKRFTIFPAFWYSRQRIVGGFWYRATLFGEDAIAGFVHEFESLTQKLVDSPGERV